MIKQSMSDFINAMADQATENADMKSLEQYFYEGQIDYLNSLSNEELLYHINDFMPEYNEELEKILNEGKKNG